MKAIYYDGALSIKDIPAPEPGPGEALVRVSMAGICGTDMEILKGYMNFKGVPGHEFVGVVSECEDQDWMGKRVAGEINLGCGCCEYCRQGLQRHCPDRTVLGILKKDGAFAEYLTLPCSNLHVIPDEIPDEEAVFTEPVAAATEILEQIYITASSRIAVLGDGRLGLIISQVLRTTGCDLLVVGQSSHKLDILRQKGINVKTDTEEIKEQFDIVVEATGSPKGFEKALDLLRPRGKLVLKSTYHQPIRVYCARWVIDEIEIVGSRCGRFEPALKLLREKKIDVTGLISKTFLFEEGLKAFEYAEQPEAIKVLLQM